MIDAQIVAAGDIAALAGLLKIGNRLAAVLVDAQALRIHHAQIVAAIGIAARTGQLIERGGPGIVLGHAAALGMIDAQVETAGGFPALAGLPTLHRRQTLDVEIAGHHDRGSARTPTACIHQS